MRVSQKVALMASAIVVLAFTAFSILQYRAVSDALYNKAAENIDEESVVLSHQISGWLNGKLALIDLMANTLDSDFTGQSIQRSFGAALLKREFILVFGGLDSDGVAISNDPSWSPPKDWDARQRPWYPLARANQRAVLTEPYTDSATQEVLISAVAQFSKNGVFKGAFGGDISLKTVSDALNTLSFGGTGYTFLINSQGGIISHPDSTLNGQSIDKLYGDTQPQLNDTLQQLEVGGKAVLTAFQPLSGLAGSDWLIGVVLDKDKVMADADAFGLNAIIGAVITAILSTVVIYFSMGRLLRPLQQLRTSLADLNDGQGDLTKRLDITTKDEFGQLSQGFNEFLSYLQSLVGDCKSVSKELNSNTDQSAGLAAASAGDLKRQFNELDQLSTAMSEMASTALEVAGSAQHAADTALQADNAAEQGVDVVRRSNTAIAQLSSNMEQAVVTVSELAQYSNNIESILTVIKSIAEQTNLLALNAAIEAARAGEQGRGFAVVADEVRALASRTQESTEEIQHMIEQLQSGVQKAEQTIMQSREMAGKTHQTAAEADQALLEIRRRISEINDITVQIATAAEQQSATTDEVNRNTTNIRDIGQLVSDSAHDQSSLCAGMVDLNRRQDDSLSKFRV
ncbi:MAG: methyl-accepting chemotaxis protein [Motiliproteus sp.]